MSANSVAKTRSSPGRRALVWGALTTVFASAVYCSLPLLVAAGVGGSALAAVSALVRPGIELAFGLPVGLVVFGVLVARARARSRAQCLAGGACGCEAPSTILYSSPKPAPDEPVVCTADLASKAGVQPQLEGYRVAFARWLRTENSTAGFRWIFAREPGLEQRLLRLMESEHECCRFFEFELQSTPDELIWVTRGTQASASVVEEFARLPQRLTEHGAGPAGMAAIQRHFTATGLSFSDDRGNLG